MSAYTVAEHCALAAAYAFLAAKQTAGEAVNKAQLIRELQAGACSARSRGAIEAKFMNLSHVAQVAGLFPQLPGGYVKGYKPAPNGAKVLLAYLQAALKDDVRVAA